jgi:hypothetical protein
MFDIEYIGTDHGNWIHASSSASETGATNTARNKLKHSHVRSVRVVDKDTGNVVFVDNN